MLPSSLLLLLLLARRGAGAGHVVVDFGNHNCNCSLPKFMKCAVVDDDFATCPASAWAVCLPACCLPAYACAYVCLSVRLSVCLSVFAFPAFSFIIKNCSLFALIFLLAFIILRQMNFNGKSHAPSPLPCHLYFLRFYCIIYSAAAKFCRIASLFSPLFLADIFKLFAPTSVSGLC